MKLILDIKNKEDKMKKIILLVILLVAFTLPVLANTYNYTPYPGKQIDIILNNEGMNFVGTITYPENIDKPCPAILLLPGFTGERDELPITNTFSPAEGGKPQGMWERTALKLADAGYVSLRIDYRNSGKSEGLWQDITVTGELSDAIVALKYLAENSAVDKNKLAVCGLSQGGSLASCMSNEPLVKAVILWSAAPDFSWLDTMVPTENLPELKEKGIVTFELPWGETITFKQAYFDSAKELFPLKEIAKFKGPLLNIYATKDESVTPQPQQAQKFMDAHQGEETLVTIEADHTFGNFSGFEKVDEAIDETVKWLDEYLKP